MNPSPGFPKQFRTQVYEWTQYQPPSFNAKKSTSPNSCALTYKSERPEQYEIAIIKNQIYRSKFTSSSKTIFYSEFKNIKQTHINNNFPNHIVVEQIKCANKNLNSYCYENNTTSNNPKHLKLFFRKQIYTTNSMKQH